MHIPPQAENTNNYNELRSFTFFEKDGPCEAGALIAVVNDYVFVDKIYSGSTMGFGLKVRCALQSGHLHEYGQLRIPLGGHVAKARDHTRWGGRGDHSQLPVCVVKS